MRIFFLASLFTVYGITLSAQLPLFGANPEKPRLITGPVLGAVTATTANLWIAYKGNGQNMMTLVDTTDKTVYYATGFRKINNNTGITALTMEFKDLKPDRVYKAVFNNPLTPHTKCVFRTPDTATIKDFDFIFGSCALLNTDFSRFIFPGAASRIFPTMKKQKSSFMVWLGDNLYYFGKQYTSYQRMFMRNLNIRLGFPELREFLVSQPNYTIWDDHDYGWNDSDKKFPLKDTSIVIYKGFWPNPYPEKQSFQGNYFTFKYADAEFFMTDNRWYRDPEGDTTGDYLGKDQLAWLKEQLLASKANFKFICSGSTVLDDSYWGESWAKYPRELHNLFDFIVTNNIKGVIFLSGDRHYAELSKINWKGYTFYDFTSSPITSPAVSYRVVKGYHNSRAIDNTVVYKRNFGKVLLSGPAGNRVCKLELYGNGGKRLWAYELNGTDLEKRTERKK